MTEQMLLDRMAQMIRVGFVNARRPEKMRVKVTVRDTTNAPLVTDWLPVLCPRASGDMQYDLPDIDDQVLCLFLPYGLEQGFVIGAMYGRQVPPAQSGDKWHRKFSDGTTLEYDRASHKLTANVQGDVDGTATGSVTMKAEGPMSLEAPIIYVRGTLVNTATDGTPGKAVFSGGLTVQDGGISVPRGDIVAFGVSLASHTTDGVEPGSGISGTPTGGSPQSPGVAALSAAAAASAANIAGNLASLAADVSQNGSDVDKLILCLPEITAAMAERETTEADKQGWLYLHDMFERWLSSPANTDALRNPAPLRIGWQWAMSYLRAQAAYREFTSHDLQEGTVYSQASMKSLATILCKNGYLDETKEETTFDLTTSDWKEWEKLYFTLYKVPYPLSQPVERDGLYTALGAFTLRALAGGRVKNMGNGKWELTLEKVSVFVHDTFNFAADFFGETIGLGYWSCEKRDGARSDRPDATYLPLSNRVFRNFRDAYGRGGDFLVLSQPHPVENIRGTRYEFSCPK